MPLDSLAKQIVDVDSHEMIPAGLRGDAFPRQALQRT